MLFIGRVALRPPPLLASRTLVLDLDETLLWRPRGAVDAVALYLGQGVGRPYPGALRALQSLSAHYALVAVTARWSVAERGTAAWLAAHGLGHVPVIYASHARPLDASRAGYKAAALRRLREEGWTPVYGVGDRPSDLAAYSSEGVPALMVAHAQGGDAPAVLRGLQLNSGSASSLSSGATDAASRTLSSGATASAAASVRVRCLSDDARVHANPADAGLSHGHLHVPAAMDGGIPPVWEQIEALLLAEAAVSA